MGQSLTLFLLVVPVGNLDSKCFDIMFFDYEGCHVSVKWAISRKLSHQLHAFFVIFGRFRPRFARISQKTYGVAAKVFEIWPTQTLLPNFHRVFQILFNLIINLNILLSLVSLVAINKNLDFDQTGVVDDRFSLILPLPRLKFEMAFPLVGSLSK